MKWILIAWIVTGNNNGLAVDAIDVEFNSRDACDAAGRYLLETKDNRRGLMPDVKRWDNYICVAKGEESKTETE